MPFKDPAKRKEYNKEYGRKNNKKLWQKRKNDPTYRLYQKEYDKEYRKKYEKTIKRRFYKTRRNALKRGIVFTLTLEEFILKIANACAYCNNLLGPKSQYESGLDRMDNSKGYTFENTCSCCKVCNSIKGQYLSFKETKEIIDLIIKMRNLK